MKKKSLWQLNKKTNIWGKIPLMSVLIIPFLLKILIIVGLIGWLSFRNGQRAINNLATKLRQQVVAHIVEQIDNYLQIPHQINKLSAYAVKEDNLTIFPVQGQGLFWQQMNLFQSIQWIYCGSPEKGEFMGVTRLGKNDGLWLTFSNESTDFFSYESPLDSQGNIIDSVTKRSKISQKFDARNRPWYQAGVKAGKPTWSRIYKGFSTEEPIISAVLPVYDSQNNLKAVCGVDIYFSQELNKVLTTIEIGRTGEAFILDTKGVLIASSIRKLKSEEKDELGIEKAINSNNKLIKSATQHLTEQYQNLTEIDTKKQLDFILNGERIFMEVSPYEDEYGLDWLTVVVIPENEFMAQIKANTRSTIQLCILALATALVLGLLTVKWITKPIIKLSTAARAISHGELNQNVPIQGVKELVILAESFNHMTQQLEESFNDLETKNQELQHLDELKDEFLANTSHELRTPLNGMIGIAESMIDGATGAISELQKNNLSMIVGSGYRLANLVNDILDFSKLRHHNIELQIGSVGMREVTEVVLTFSRMMLLGKDLQLVNAIPSDFPAAAADENRVQQILHNLVGNAIKFTECGVVKVSGELIDVNNNQQMAITVSDNGIGIPEDKQEAIFASFEQGDGSTERRYGGTGLGLPITKKLVELHGGNIWVKSTPGIGSEFTFTLNISDKPAHTTSAESSVKRQISVFNTDYLAKSILDETNSLSQKYTPISTVSLSNQEEFKIMIVDDEPVNLMVLSNQLSLYNYQVIQANNGQEALDILEQSFLPDLILLDVMMPGMTGYEVTQKVRQIWPLHQLPIMMLTAKNRVSDLVIGLEAGANDYLSKPFHKEELLARIKTHINIKKLRTEKAHIRQAFGRYLTDEVVSNLLETPEGLKLGGERKKVTILTSDIRGFTGISERFAPEEVVNVLNFYLSSMADVIMSFQGTIDEFMGDGILVLFGAPNPRKDDAKRAVACGVAMQQKMLSVNKQMEAWGLVPLEMGIGINTGEVVVGNIGSEKRTKYAVVGNQVNLTYRIESYSTGGEILISETTLQEVGESILRIDGQKLVQPKGVKQPINIYNISGISGEYNIFLEKEEEVFLDLTEEISTQYTILEGKHVGENLFSGKLVQLSAHGALVKSDSSEANSIPSVLSNIKINLYPSTNSELVGEDIYAKVLDKPVESGYFYVLFTSKPPEVKELLDAKYSKLIPFDQKKKMKVRR
ncbi:ATP-binding protein [Okeania sp.]|uniref:ATP-binding protein n=1 Tax=Okeania sp. TaxID=3100323 RepID=UPI002B4B7971|nr:adenylate/guanylate cyclase domain-containing protein [Okeania sp.]MEB3340925.1 adenylate/guanylate cyclase domain-containing protein [Okeania sp.]